MSLVFYTLFKLIYIFDGFFTKFSLILCRIVIDFSSEFRSPLIPRIFVISPKGLFAASGQSNNLTMTLSL